MAENMYRTFLKSNAPPGKQLAPQVGCFHLSRIIKYM
jgi:hypothetical protein